MRLRSLPHTSLIVTNLCLDTSAFGRLVDARTALSILDRFCARGGNFLQVDVGDLVCGTGRPGTVVGEWLRSRAVERNELVIASRVVLPSRNGMRGSVVQHLSDAFEEVRRRLRVDHIDLGLVAMPDIRLPLGELLDAMAILVASGRVRHIGLCGFQGWRIRDAIACVSAGSLPRIAAVQSDYSFHRMEPFESDLARVCREADVAFLARAGMPSRDFAKAWHPAASHRNTVDALERFAARQSASVKQTELAWALGHPGVTSAVVRVESPDELVLLLGAAAHPQSADERAQILVEWGEALRGSDDAMEGYLSLELAPNGGLRHD